MTDTEQAPADTQVALVPAHRAGAALPGEALDTVRDAGWAAVQDQDGNYRCESADGQLHLDYLPEVEHGPLWVISSTADPAWRITADDETPVEFIKALITAVITAGPLDPRDRV